MQRKPRRLANGRKAVLNRADMPNTPIQTLTLTDFRSYPTASLACAPGVNYLFGPNGAGKTNVLEAISWLSPGRGLRGAAAVDAGRRLPGEAASRPWAVNARLADPGDLDDGVRIGIGVETSVGRRVVRVDGQPAQPGRLAELVRLVWLTPAHDRLFLEGAGERRRFLDRLVFADQPLHASHVNAYERAVRERMRLLTGEGAPDPAWLDALEQQAAEAGAAMAFARARTVAALA